MNSNQIIESICRKTQELAHAVPQDYFVGVTSDPEKRVFAEHNLCKEKSFYIYIKAKSELHAKKAYEKLTQQNMNTLPLNGKIPGNFVYCYLIEGTSKECFTTFE